mmetsp:Transcript_983/g.2357  ORF Transcript_983/g.2357 Transcript_983/m.2357 type:complete len:209 (-) Transcript_983:183-809(-)
MCLRDVVQHCRPLGSKHLHPLVVQVRDILCPVDSDKNAAAVFQKHDKGLSCGLEGLHNVRLLPGKEVAHVEVVDESLINNKFCLLGLSIAISRCDSDDFHVSHLVRAHRVLQGAEILIHAPLESRHENKVGRIGKIPKLADAVCAYCEGLLAEHVLTGLEGGRDKVKVCVGGSAHNHKVNVFICEDFGLKVTEHNSFTVKLLCESLNS